VTDLNTPRLEQAAQRRLQELFRREGRTLLQYASEASPWVPAADRDRLVRVRELSEGEFQGLEELAAFLEQRHVAPPFLGAYPMSFTAYNFIDLRKLLPMLVEHQRQAIRDIEHDFDALDGEPKEAVSRYLDLKRKHLDELQAL
jgi:hypothetical protein